MNDRDAHAAAIVDEFAAQGVGEADDRVFGGAVRRLERDSAFTWDRKSFRYRFFEP